MNDRGAVRFGNFDSTLFRSSCSQLRRYVDNRFLIVQQRPPSDLLSHSILYRLGVLFLFVAILEQTLMSTLPGIRFGTMYPPEPSVLVWAGSKKPCSFNSILVVAHPNFFAWVSAAVCTDKNSFFRHWQCLALPFPHYTSLFHIHVAKLAETFDFSLLYKLVSHSCGKACRNVWRQIRSERIGSQTSLTLSNLAVATLNNRVAVPFKTKMFQPFFDHRVV